MGWDFFSVSPFHFVPCQVKNTTLLQLLLVVQMLLKSRQIWQWHTLKSSLCSLSQSRERIMKKSSKAIFQCIFDLECAITISFAKTRFSKQKNKASKSASSTQFVEKCAIHRPSTKKRPWIGACGCAPFSKLQFQFRTQKGVSISIFLFSRGSAPTGIVWG